MWHSTRHTPLGRRPKQKLLSKATTSDMNVRDQICVVLGFHSSLGLSVECSHPFNMNTDYVVQLGA